MQQQRGWGVTPPVAQVALHRTGCAECRGAGLQKERDGKKEAGGDCCEAVRLGIRAWRSLCVAAGIRISRARVVVGCSVVCAAARRFTCCEILDIVGECRTTYQKCVGGGCVGDGQR
eukprot:TRINITY_DN58219_c0_g1_i1.p1 TRINITY_DN58219_c0_g1~~TRINITY_DN58219_c0_g1_i1.p1  ORF type:complete len:137 (+),score=7.87 TRINITY_DN58219_c0_g1_i1:61-411(+)